MDRDLDDCEKAIRNAIGAMEDALSELDRIRDGVTELKENQRED